jgi:hypothetical protein
MFWTQKLLRPPKKPDVCLINQNSGPRGTVAFPHPMELGSNLRDSKWTYQATKSVLAKGTSTLWSLSGG